LTKRKKKVACFFQITKEHIAQFLSLTGNQFYIYASSFPLMEQHYELGLQYKHYTLILGIQKVRPIDRTEPVTVAHMMKM
jgi:hypothetical protein